MKQLPSMSAMREANKARRAAGLAPRAPQFTLDEIGFDFGLSGMQVSRLASAHGGFPERARPRNQHSGRPALYHKAPVVAWLESIGRVRA